MNDPYREELVRKYFVRTPSVPSYAGPLAAIVAGGAAFLIGLVSAFSGSGAGAGCLGVLLVIGGVVGLAKGGGEYYRRSTRYNEAFRRSQPKATGVQMDRWLEDGMAHVAHIGRRRLNLHAADTDDGGRKDELTFAGFPLRAQELRIACGEDDNVLRASVYRILVVYLAGWRLSTYECLLDMATGAMYSDQTKEFHLPHVDGVETASDRVNMIVGSVPRSAAGPQDEAEYETMHVTSQQMLRLVVSGRPAIELVVDVTDDQLRIDGSGASRTDQMIARLREHLRGHMNGVQPVVPLQGGPVDPAGLPSGLTDR
jgi:hypothetical protein